MKTIILISGRLQSGKNTFAELLSKELEKHGRSILFDMFAKDLKELCASAFSPLMKLLKKYRNNLFQEGFGGNPNILDIADKLILKPANFYEDKTEISRTLLQIVGTDIVRNFSGENTWVDKFIDRSITENYDIKLVTDVRFPNEIDRVRKYDHEDYHIVTIRVERELDRSSAENEHESEKALDDYGNWDFIVDNNGTQQDLQDSAEVIAEEIIKFRF